MKNVRRWGGHHRRRRGVGSLSPPSPPLPQDLAEGRVPPATAASPPATAGHCRRLPSRRMWWMGERRPLPPPPLPPPQAAADSSIPIRSGGGGGGGTRRFPPTAAMPLPLPPLQPDLAEDFIFFLKKGTYSCLKVLFFLCFQPEEVGKGS